jgi:[acyl-carrier-protein] S-malonyltransferase
LTAVNLVCWQALHKAGIKADYVVGHSLGEYAALHAAGVLTMADTIRLVARRGQVMGQAGERSPGGMVAILGLDLTTVQEILAAVAAPEAISIGNYNSEQQLVLSGSAEALQRASELAVAKGGKAVALNVSVANHSPLMAQAVPEFEQALAATPMQPPTIPVLFNVTARTEADPEAIRAIMARQIVSMVRWQEIITALLAAGVETFIECGPKKVLSGLMKRMLPKGGGHRCLQIETPAGLAEVISALAGGVQGRA